MVRKLRRFLFNVISISPLRLRASRRLKQDNMPYSFVCRLEVNLPPNRQFSGNYPALVDRLCSDWGAGLSGLSCSSGDFRAALIRGDEISLGHIWAEIFCLCLDRVFSAFEGHHIHFSDETTPSLTGIGDNRIEYKIIFSFSEPYPLEFMGVEYIVNGYLNSLLENRPFDIQQRLKDFIEHRTDHSESEPNKAAP